MSGALPTFLIIGAMKCGTTAVHGALGEHPQVAVSQPKELNFFLGGEAPPADAADPWAAGNHWRGAEWYAAQLPAAAPVRGEASPGYTSPSHPEAADRIADLLPDVRLVYLVRDPIARAVSQHRHHRRDGSEARPLAEALLDPASQYVARSRFHERLVPFLRRFPRDRVLIVAAEDLGSAPGATMHRVLDFLGADPAALPRERLPAPTRAAQPVLDHQLRRRMAALLRDDADRLRQVAGQRFPTWSV